MTIIKFFEHRLNKDGKKGIKILEKLGAKTDFELIEIKGYYSNLVGTFSNQLRAGFALLPKIISEDTLKTRIISAILPENIYVVESDWQMEDWRKSILGISGETSYDIFLVYKERKAHIMRFGGSEMNESEYKSGGGLVIMPRFTDRDHEIYDEKEDKIITKLKQYYYKLREKYKVGWLTDLYNQRFDWTSTTKEIEKFNISPRFCISRSPEEHRLYVIFDRKNENSVGIPYKNSPNKIVEDLNDICPWNTLSMEYIRAQIKYLSEMWRTI